MLVAVVLAAVKVEAEAADIGPIQDTPCAFTGQLFLHQSVCPAGPAPETRMLGRVVRRMALEERRVRIKCDVEELCACVD